MSRVVARLIVVAALAVVTTGVAARSQDPDFIVHEWGTFTTVAGDGGTAIDWLPLGGPQDLPCFVNRFQDRFDVKFAVDAPPPPTYAQARRTLRGTVRMETPVLYFYASRETTVNVSVRFRQGLMTEWYPKAHVTQGNAAVIIRSPGAESAISWNGVTIRPGAQPALPLEGAPSHYYAAREVDAAPVQVWGQDEKFLFYRGVGGFQVPLSTVVTKDGRIRVTSTSQAALPSVVLFESRGGRIGYRVHGALKGEVTLDRPELSADVKKLGRDLEKILVATGLFAREAKAMVETWRDSWFEEGTRVFYIVPPADVEAMLPLSVNPAPAKVARAFVGRMEIITPEVIRDVRDAIAEGDNAALRQFGRFLGPIGERIAAIANPAERDRTAAVLGEAYKAYVSHGAALCK